MARTKTYSRRTGCRSSVGFRGTAQPQPELILNASIGPNTGKVKHSLKSNTPVRELTNIFGYKEANFQTPGLHNNVHLDAESFARHVDLARSSYFTFLPETITAPYEVWMSFEQHKGTGKVELRTRFIKIVGLDKARSVFMVAQARKGTLEVWTIFSQRNASYLNKQRVGKLIWKREG